MLTKEQMLDLIETNLGVKGDDAREKAERGYNAALTSLGKIDVIPWNKISDTFSLTSGTDEYVLGSDILTDHNNIKGVTQLWRTDEKNWPIHIYHLDRFNSYKRGNTDTGKPYCATVHNNSDGEKTLEFFYTPDDSYPLWIQVRLPLTLDMIDDDYLDIVVWKAVMAVSDPKNGYYQKAKEEYVDIINALRKVSYIKWEGTQIQPGYTFGHGQGQLGIDSGRFWDFT